MITKDYFLQPGHSYQRLYKEFKQYGSICVGFDFDDTVHDYHKRGHQFDLVIELLRDLSKLNCRLVCWTAHPDHDYVAKYLDDHGIPFDNINGEGIELQWTSRKPFFSALLDDRAGLLQVYEDLYKLVMQIKLEKLEQQ